MYSDSRSAAARAAARRAVARFPGHDSRGLRHAAPLGAGTLAARMGPAHQKSDRRTSSDALLGFSRRRGKYAARSMARQEQLGIAAAAAVALQRFAAMSDFEVKPLASPARNTTMSSMHPGDTVVVLRARNRSQQPSCGPHPAVTANMYNTRTSIASQEQNDLRYPQVHVYTLCAQILRMSVSSVDAQVCACFCFKHAQNLRMS